MVHCPPFPGSSHSWGQASDRKSWPESLQHRQPLWPGCAGGSDEVRADRGARLCRPAQDLQGELLPRSLSLLLPSLLTALFDFSKLSTLLSHKQSRLLPVWTGVYAPATFQCLRLQQKDYNFFNVSAIHQSAYSARFMCVCVFYK